MTLRKLRWTPLLTQPAVADLTAIHAWTRRQFGQEQARRYRRLILARVGDLTYGPSLPGAKQRPELGADLYSLRLSRSGQRASHVVIFRPVANQRILILRILHESQDPWRHLPEP